MREIINIQNLTKEYKNEVKTLKGINLKIYENEVFVIVGPNGAGKTTLLYIISTILKPTEGSVYVMGYDVTKNPGKIRELLGFAFTEITLFNTTVYKALWAHGRIYGIPKNELRQRILNCLNELDIIDKSDSIIWELSSGQRKRVEICKVIIQRPKIAIFDEPTITVDIDGKHKVWSLIKNLKKYGSTVIIATNDIYEAEYLADRVAILNKGELLAVGSIDELKKPLGSEVLELEVSNPNVISKISHLGRIIVSGNYIRLYSDKLQDIIKEISTLNGIISIRRLNVTLDDVFLVLTGGVKQ
ncbi:ABC transporter ATP-binding protein [Sulfurisphaera ohwakuensis]|uniref:ABC-2 type transport system ATP-binding protein n=1 Tax=Sulfurisphaera ohwakuensis TaxID=69656 RepID=A0A650CDD3_SULOH|nr:ATP-binding cassette domain-containing protein [Sulfurisphaera ohwakuensis]MBB5255193.1 ABC-2 type transport system ATP-binding protein [Sulfurisphaera ohwakuensis]QGR15788.1 ATP-binding cassette domain-containing protein [Sulfurisphaera ohwakuensis]